MLKSGSITFPQAELVTVIWDTLPGSFFSLTGVLQYTDLTCLSDASKSTEPKTFQMSVELLHFGSIHLPFESCMSLEGDLSTNILMIFRDETC